MTIPKQRTHKKTATATQKDWLYGKRADDSGVQEIGSYQENGQTIRVFSPGYAYGITPQMLESLR